MEHLSSSLDRDEAEGIREELILAYRKGFRVVFIVGGALAALATVLVVLLMPQVPLDRPDDEKLKEEGRTGNEQNKRVDAVDQTTDISAHHKQMEEVAHDGGHGPGKASFD